MTDILDIFLLYLLMLAIGFMFVVLVFKSVESLIKFKAIPLCKIGVHKMYRHEEGIRKANYYCSWCKKARKYPELKVIQGDKKFPMTKMKG